MKTWFVAIALCSMASLVCAAPDELEDTFNNLKAAEAKKDPDGVKKLASQASKLARAAVAAPQPSEAEQVEMWKQKVEYAKGVDSYSEYSLATMARQPGIAPEKAVELIEELQVQNPKSKYLDAGATVAYITALGGAAGTQSGKSPDRALGYANKLLGVVRSRPKPEGLADADWERLKSESMGTGLYIAGMVHGQKQSWVDCNRDLSAALPYVQKDNTRLGPLYFTLGLCNYQFGKITQDRSKIMAGEKYSELSAAIPGPMQAQANQNAISMKRELGGAGTKR